MRPTKSWPWRDLRSRRALPVGAQGSARGSVHHVQSEYTAGGNCS
ncbi:Uncharacterised protein [Vibrio cholerae]|nr:Uncharacterised protein [Vibrio cholerae]